MAEFKYRIVNVFTEERLAGNPPAVFGDARGMDDAAMQANAAKTRPARQTRNSLASALGLGRLRLSVDDEAGKIVVAGRVIEVGRGTASL